MMLHQNIVPLRRDFFFLKWQELNPPQPREIIKLSPQWSEKNKKQNKADKNMNLQKNKID